MDVLKGSNGLPVQIVPSLAHVKFHSGEVSLDGAHVQHFVAALAPCFSDVLGSRFQVFGPSHDPAQDPYCVGGISGWAPFLTWRNVQTKYFWH